MIDSTTAPTIWSCLTPDEKYALLNAINQSTSFLGVLGPWELTVLDRWVRKNPLRLGGPVEASIVRTKGGWRSETHTRVYRSLAKAKETVDRRLLDDGWELAGAPKKGK